MQKKLQIFISSTYTDLIEERQAAVEAVLNSGHIPAGMELFKSEDATQKEIIKRWIDESDVYLLILGGRYGSIDEETGKSYTHWEYDYAEKAGKPRFAIVINDNALDLKVKQSGLLVTERDNYEKYKEFKSLILTKITKFFNDTKDIKLAILESLKEFEKYPSLYGWVSGQEIKNYENIIQDNYQLLKENAQLKQQLDNILQKNLINNEIDGSSFEDIKSYLKSKEIEIPKNIFDSDKIVGKKVSVYNLFILLKEKYMIGVSNNLGMDPISKFAFFTLAPELMPFSLVEKIKLSGTQAQRIQLSKTGNKFLKIALLQKNSL